MPHAKANSNPPANRDEPALRETRAFTASLLLASRSPRRRAMLEEAGVAVVAEHPGFDDSVLETGGVFMPADRWVAALAYLKARAGLDLAQERNIPWSLGADTACIVRDGLITHTIGTPRTADEALAMLRVMLPKSNALITNTHEVITGCALINVATRKRIIFTDTARVHMGPLDDATLFAYIASGNWQGKAGAYNLADRVASGWHIRVEGDPATVMGLPMIRLARLFAVLGLGASNSRRTQA